MVLVLVKHLLYLHRAKAEALLVRTSLVRNDLVAKINDGWLDFDVVIATPDMMALVGRLDVSRTTAMPNPKAVL